MKILNLIVISIFLGSCSSRIEKIPLENINEHRAFLSTRDDSELEDFKVYEKMLNENPDLSNSPYIFYYLSRLENDKQYLNIGLKLFPDDPYINFNRKKYINSDEEEVNLYRDILKKHPKHNLSLINYLASQYIFMEDYDETNLINDSKLIYEVYDIVDKYLDYSDNTSKFYDFKNKELFKLDDLSEQFISKSISKIKSLKNKVYSMLKLCEGRSSDLKSYETRRILNISNMSFYEESKVNYLGNCEYQITHNVVDYMYNSQYNLIINYLYIDRNWKKKSSKTYKNIYGQWVLQ